MNMFKPAAVALLAGISFGAQAAVIDFTTMADGSVSRIGDAVFSLAGTGEAGDPSVSSAFGGGLWNSTDGASYPTNTILRVDFDSTVTDLSWIFDNEGSKETTYTLYDAALNVLATGLNSSLSGFQNYDFSSLTGVSRIEWNNLGNNWLFALGSIEYDAEAASVPEPGTLALLGIGLLGVAFSRRKLAAA